MKPISVAVVGTGWCGGIRAETLAAHALVKELHLAETRAERLAELKQKLSPASAVAGHKRALGEDLVPVRELHPDLGIRKHLLHGALHLDHLFFCQGTLLAPTGALNAVNTEYGSAPANAISHHASMPV